MMKGDTHMNTMITITRRYLLRFAGLFGVGSALPASALAAAQKKAAVPAAAAEPNVYASIGVRPLINCRGTLTIIGGSVELPEVRAAKTAANQQYAQLDEVMDGVGKRLAELTGAEWGMVSAGCAAAISHATAACVAGGNPDLHVRIPNLAGFPKDEVIIPTNSRNVYDAAIRAVGVKVLEVDTPEALTLAIGPKTAMIYLFAGPRTDSGPMSTEAICAIAKQHDVPVMVDAAAEILTIPNVHLQRGATLVGYSGGKFIRGPQSAGLLLGPEGSREGGMDPQRAPPRLRARHEGRPRGDDRDAGRGRELGEARSRAEWAEWVARCDYIAERASQGRRYHRAGTARARCQLEQPQPARDAAVGFPATWHHRRRGLGSARERRAAHCARRRRRRRRGWSGAAGRQRHLDHGGDDAARRRESRRAADRRGAVGQAHAEARRSAGDPRDNLSGRWDVEINYAASGTTHRLHLQQNGNRLDGIHQGNFLTRDITGTISGDMVTLSSNVTERHGDSLNYRFRGKVSGDTMSGDLDLGEYRTATWTARRPRTTVWTRVYPGRVVTVHSPNLHRRGDSRAVASITGTASDANSYVRDEELARQFAELKQIRIPTEFADKLATVLRESQADKADRCHESRLNADAVTT